MISLDCDNNFQRWREQARRLLSHRIAPCDVIWADGHTQDLLSQNHGLPNTLGSFQAQVPPALLEQLEQAGRYRGKQRWSLLYEVLWRVAHGDRSAMLAGDRLGSELQRRIKQVRREAHHLHAFVRFMPVPTELVEHLQLDWLAFHEPAHDILASASGHFANRMGRLRWLIATPLDGIRFNADKLEYRRQCPEEWRQWAQCADDPEGELWRTYYRHIFNPARINPGAMSQHMPVRFWRHLPEAELIPQLVGQARRGKQRDGQATELAAQDGKRIRSPSHPPRLNQANAPSN